MPSFLSYCAVLLCLAGSDADSGTRVLTLDGAPANPFAGTPAARVLLFVRTDCPITNRYAPELQRLFSEFSSRQVTFWLVYADHTGSAAEIRKQVADYRLPGNPVLDPQHTLVARAQATVAPEAAVFDSAGRLRYHGRIDNKWVDAGKSRPAPTVHDLENAIGAVLAGKPVAVPATKAIGCALSDVE